MRVVETIPSVVSNLLLCVPALGKLIFPLGYEPILVMHHSRGSIDFRHHQNLASEIFTFTDSADIHRPRNKKLFQQKTRTCKRADKTSHAGVASDRRLQTILGVDISCYQIIPEPSIPTPSVRFTPLGSQRLSAPSHSSPRGGSTDARGAPVHWCGPLRWRANQRWSWFRPIAVRRRCTPPLQV